MLQDRPAVIAGDILHDPLGEAGGASSSSLHGAHAPWRAPRPPRFTRTPLDCKRSAGQLLTQSQPPASSPRAWPGLSSEL